MVFQRLTFFYYPKELIIRAAFHMFLLAFCGVCNVESHGKIRFLAFGLIVLLLLCCLNTVSTTGCQDIKETATQKALASVVWSDDFSDGNYDGWTVNRGGYSAVDGAMRGTTSTFNWAHHSSTTATGTWTFDFYFRGTNGMVVWFICNNLVVGDYNRPKDGYGVEITLPYDEDYPLLRLWKNVADSESVLDLYDFAMDATGWWHFEITRDATNEIKIYLNDTLRLSTTDSAHSSSSYFYLHGFNTQAIDNIIVDDASPLTEPETTRLTESSTDLSVGDTHIDADDHLWVSWIDSSNLDSMISDTGTISLLPAGTNMSPENDGSSDNDQASSILRDQNGTLWLVYSVGTTVTSESLYIRSYTSGVLGNRHQVAQTAGTNREADLVQYSNGSYSLFFSGSNNIYTASSWHGFITHSDDLMTWTTPTQVTSTWGRMTRMTIDNQDNLYALIDNNNDGLKVSKSEDGTSWAPAITATSGHYGDIHYSTSQEKLFVAFFNPSDSNIWLTESSDGTSWSTPTIVVDRASTSNTECRICEDVRGNLLVTYMDNVGGHNDLFVAYFTGASITTGTTTTTPIPPITEPTLDPLLLLSAGGLALVAIFALVIVSRRRRERTPPYQTRKYTTTAPPESAAPIDTVENRELVLGALKSYPRVSMRELSDLLELPVDQVRRLTLRLIAAGSIVGAFDRSMDEFVSVSASEVGRELRSDDSILKEIPNCPHCGAPFARQIGIGETVHCDNCGKTFSG